jgi:hypothetical protein
VDIIDALEKSGWTSDSKKDYCPKCWIEFEQLKVNRRSDTPVPPEKPTLVEKPEKPKAVHAEREYHTEKEVAEIMSVSLATLRNHRFQMKGLPYIKLGRAVRYKLKI